MIGNLRLLILALPVGLVFAACSSSTDPIAVPTGDGGKLGPDASSDGTAPLTDGMPGPVVDALDGVPYCDTYTRFASRCGATDSGLTAACIGAQHAQCPEVAMRYSADWISAVQACFAQERPCDRKANDQCAQDKLMAFTPSAAQAKLRNDYCATCESDASADCKTKFFFAGTGSSAVPGDGATALLLTDAVVSQIDTKCTGAALVVTAGDCNGAFTNCYQATYDAAFPPVPPSCTK